LSPDLIANVAAEQIILGAMLTSADAVAETQIMAPQDFMRPAHQMIFENIRWLAARQEPGDPVAVAARMLATGELKRAGGAGYLHTLMASVPVAVNTAY
jgi:replicative DNA helicase